MEAAADAGPGRVADGATAAEGATKAVKEEEGRRRREEKREGGQQLALEKEAKEE